MNQINAPKKKVKFVVVTYFKDGLPPKIQGVSDIFEARYWRDYWLKNSFTICSKIFEEMKEE